MSDHQIGVSVHKICWSVHITCVPVHTRDVSHHKTGVSILKTDVSILKTDVSVHKRIKSIKYLFKITLFHPVCTHLSYCVCCQCFEFKWQHLMKAEYTLYVNIDSKTLLKDNNKP